MKLILMLGFTVVLLLAVFVSQTSAAQAMSTLVEAQLRAALPHSRELLQRGLGILTPQTHLQLVINCFEGPNGRNFKAAVGDVCKGLGNGILPDLKAAVAAKEKGADLALRYATVAWREALAAVILADGNEVEQHAEVVSSYLQRALDVLP